MRTSGQLNTIRVGIVGEQPIATQDVLQKLLAARQEYAVEILSLHQLLVSNSTTDIDVLVLVETTLTESLKHLIHRLRRDRIHVPMILVATEPNAEGVVSALQMGIDDYIRIDCLEQLPIAITRVSRIGRYLQSDVTKATASLPDQPAFPWHLYGESPFGVVVVEAETQVVRYINREFELLAGVDGKTVVGHTPAAAPPGVASLMNDLKNECSIDQAIHSVTSFRSFSAAQTDGTSVTFEFCSWKTIWLSSQYQVFLIRDITAEFQAHVRLRESERQLQAIFDTEPECVKLLDAQGALLRMNPAGLRMIEADAFVDVAGRCVYPLVVEDDRESVRQLTERVFQGESGVLEFKVVGLKGTMRWLETHASPLRSATGEVSALLAITRDVSPVKKAYSEIERRRAELQLVLDTVPALIFYKDRDRRFIMVNRTHAELVGRPAEVYVGKTDSELGSPFAERYQEDDLFVMKTGQAIRGREEPIHTPSGLRWLLTDKLPRFDSDGAIAGVVGFAVDITEQKLSKERIQHSEATYRLLFDSNPLPMWVYDLETLKFLAVNDAAVAHYGYSREEFHAMTIADIRPPEEIPLLLQSVAQRTPGYSYAGVWVHLKKDQTRILVEITSHNLIFGGCEAELILANDVTLKQRAESALRESREKLQLAIRASNAGLWDWDLQTNEVEYSVEWKRQIGFEDHEISNRVVEWSSRIHPEDLEGALATVREYLQDQTKQYESVFRLRHKDGSYRAIVSRGQLIADDSGVPRRLIGFHLDFTEREQVRESLQMKDRAIAATTQGILITGPIRDDCPIIYVNPGFERITGYTATEIVGSNCRFLQGEKTDKAALERIQLALCNGHPVKEELLNYRKDGTLFWNELSITPIRDDHGNVTHFVGVQSDVSARRATEEQLRQSQKMEVVGQLAGGVAHDFNNLLTIISGYASLLRSEASLHENELLFLNEIEVASDRAAELTRRLLAFGHRQFRNPEATNVNEIAVEMIKLLERTIGKHIALKLETEESLSPVVIDQGELSQVFLNLALNARDAMPQGGQLCITTRNLETNKELQIANTAIPPGKYVEITVADNGCGMSEEVQKHIFEPFFTTKPIGQGTGLGLAMVHSTITHFAGRVAVQSAVNHGTKISIFLPASVLQVVKSSLRVDMPQPTQKAEGILLVEDDDALRVMATTILTRQGYSVTAVSGARTALAILRDSPNAFELLLTDLVMPEIRGDVLVKEARTSMPHLRILIISGYSGAEKPFNTDDCGGSDFLTKPFTPRQLLEKVHVILKSSR